MSLIELIGSILGRAQIIEELMRMYIVDACDAYTHPREVIGTFGVLKNEFKKLHPDETELLECLDHANEIRNEAAHDDFLIALWVHDALDGQDPDAVDRFNRKGVRKSVMVIDECLIRFLRFRSTHPIQYEAKIRPD